MGTLLGGSLLAKIPKYVSLSYAQRERERERERERNFYTHTNQTGKILQGDSGENVPLIKLPTWNQKHPYPKQKGCRDDGETSLKE